MCVIDINSDLQKMCRELNSHNALNYTVNIELYKSENNAGKSVKEIIENGFGNPVVIGNYQLTTKKKILKELKNGFNYQGDGGSHPNQKYLFTDTHKELCNKIENKVSNLLSKSDFILEFSLEEGHPFYPVFWDFSFMFEYNNNGYILIGSSSD